LVASLTKKIQLSNDEKHRDLNNVDPKEYRSIFPHLTVLIRDSFLEVKDRQGQIITPNEYLLNCIAPLPGLDQHTVEQNKIRAAIRDSFRAIDCLLMSKPRD
jgi:hypothetical protein